MKDDLFSPDTSPTASTSPPTGTSMVNLPNLITLGRIISVPLVVWLILSGQNAAAFGIFLLAGISDGVDGYLAKRFGWQTELGAYLDAVADKLLLVSIYLALAGTGDLPIWLVIMVVARDIFIVGGVMLAWILENPLKVEPSYISKVNTTAQILLAGAVLANDGFALGLGTTLTALVLMTALLTFWSAATYLRVWLRHMTGSNNPGEGPP